MEECLKTENIMDPASSEGKHQRQTEKLISEPQVPDDTVRQSLCTRACHFLPKRIVVAIFIFLTSSAYYMIYTGFNILLLTMVVKDPTKVDRDSIIHQNIGKRYDWSESEQLQATCVFNIGEIISAIPAGMLVEKKGPRFIIGVGLSVAGGLNFLLPYAAQLGISFMCMWRLIQGFFCGGIIVGFHFLISRWAPHHEQCKFVFAIIGNMVGTSYTYVLIIKLLHHFKDYYIGFFITGGIATVWGVIWILMISNTPRSHPYISEKELLYITKHVDPVIEQKYHYLSFYQMFTSKRFWALMIVALSSENGLMTLLSLGPKYFEDFHHGLSVTQKFLPSMCLLIFSLVCCIFVDLSCKWTRITRTVLVKIFIIFSHFIPGILLCILWAVHRNDYLHAYLLYTSCFIAIGASTITALSIFHDLAPNHAAQLFGYSRFISLSVCVCTKHIGSGILTVKSPAVAFEILFLLLASIYFLGGLIFLLLGSAKLQKWNFHQSSFQYYIFEALSAIDADPNIKTK